MIHQFRNNGYNIVLDVNSGSVHVVDDVSYDVIRLLDEGADEQECMSSLAGTWPEVDLKESYRECMQLKEAGVLFTQDVYEEAVLDFKARTV